MLKCIFHFPYRQTEYIAQGHTKWKLPSILDYSIINKRINRLDIEIEDGNSKKFQNDYLIIAIDSTGIKVTTGCQWLRSL